MVANKMIDLKKLYPNKSEFVLNQDEFILICDLMDNSKQIFLVKNSESSFLEVPVKSLKIIGNKQNFEKFSLFNKIDIPISKMVETIGAVNILFVAKNNRVSFKPLVNASTDIKKKGKSKVLIIDDSSVIRKLLAKIINSSDELEVCAAVDGPNSAMEYLENYTPDIITLDIHMPEMDGVTFFKTFLKDKNIPTVIISSMSMQEGPMVMEALSSGVLAYIEKPEASKVALVGEEIKSQLRQFVNLERHRKVIMNTNTKATGNFKDSEGIIAIGSSTGGTRALEVILTSLPSRIPPILVVQHIPEVFSKAFADRLDRICPFDVKEAEHGETVKPNTVYIAKGGYQMEVSPNGKEFKLNVLDIDYPNTNFKPSVDCLFNSIFKNPKKNMVCCILTGMGRDGSEGLLKLQKIGAKTIGQNEESCVVYGMPRSANALGACDEMVHINDMAQSVIKAYNQD